MHSQPALSQQPKVNPYTKLYPCSYHKASFSLFLCPTTSSYFGNLEFHYLSSELTKINFELEAHHSVPKPERSPRQKARAIVGLTVFLYSRLRALCYLSMPENSKNLISFFFQEFNILCEFQYPYIQVLHIFCSVHSFLFFFFCQESKSAIIPVSWSEAEVKDY